MPQWLLALHISTGVAFMHAVGWQPLKQNAASNATPSALFGWAAAAPALALPIHVLEIPALGVATSATVITVVTAALLRFDPDQVVLSQRTVYVISSQLLAIVLYLTSSATDYTHLLLYAACVTAAWIASLFAHDGIVVRGLQKMWWSAPASAIAAGWMGFAAGHGEFWALLLCTVASASLLTVAALTRWLQ